MEIQQSTNYDQFVTITGNRKINHKKVQKIVEDVKSGFNMLPYCPIIVVKQDKLGGAFGIIDGQHRYESSKKAGEPVYYLEHNDITLKQIAQLNSRGEKWTTYDFLNCYINIGVEDYQQIKLIIEEFKIPIKVACDLLMFGESLARSTEVFQNGNFECKYFEQTRELLLLTEDVFNRYAFSRDRYLIGAVKKIKEKGLCDFEVLKGKIKQAPNMMDACTTVKSYCYAIERVYNFKNQKREVII